MQTEPRRRGGPALAAALFLGSLAIAASLAVRPLPAEPDSGLLFPDEGVQVQRSRLGLAFLPAAPSGTGLIFYPAAQVPPEAYAYLGRALAEKGRTVLIASFPLGLPWLAPGRAQSLAAAYPGLEPWALGGHAQGAETAAAFIRDNSQTARGLILCAGVPGSSTDLSASSMPTLLLTGTKDGFMTVRQLERARERLPRLSRVLSLEGANRAQFGQFGELPGDGPAAIAAPLQRRAIVEEVLAFLGGLDRS